MAKVHELRCRSENTQVATGIHDPRHDAVAFQNFNRAIDGETFGDSSKVNSQLATEEDAAILAKKNVSPCCGGIRSIALAGKISPVGQNWGNRDTKYAVAFTSKLLRRPRVPARSKGAQSRSLETPHDSYVKHRFADRNSSSTDELLPHCKRRVYCTFELDRVPSQSCDLDKCAEQWAAATNFNV